MNTHVSFPAATMRAPMHNLLRVIRKSHRRADGLYEAEASFLDQKKQRQSVTAIAETRREAERRAFDLLDVVYG